MATRNSRTSTRGKKPAKKAAATTPQPPETTALDEAHAKANGIVADAKKLAAATISDAAEEAEKAVQGLLDEAQQKADTLRANAENTATTLRTEAEQAAEQLRTTTEKTAQKLLEQARTEAETLRTDAVGTAEKTRTAAEREAAKRIARATDDAETLRAEASDDADRLRAEAKTQAEALTEQARTEASTLLSKARTEAEQLRSEAAQMLARGREEADRLRTDAEAEADRLRTAGIADRDRAQSEAESVRAGAEQLRRHAQETADALRAQAEEAAARIRSSASTEAKQICKDASDEASRLSTVTAAELQRQRNQATDEARRILADAKNEASGMRSRAANELKAAEDTRVQANGEAETLRKEAQEDRAQAAAALADALNPTVQKLEKRRLQEEAAERSQTSKRNRKEQLTEQRRQRRADRKAGRPTVTERVKEFFRNNARRFMVAGPITAPMAVAWSSQTSYAMDAFGWWLPFALGFAAAWELTTTFTGWMYHQARSQGDSGLIYRVMTWVFAAGAAAMNYAHHCGPGGKPTQAAVAFATMSIVGMTLWELYASLLHRQHARKEGRVAKARPHIGLIRWARYPRQSWTAWSLTINDESLDTVEKAWAAAGHHLAQAAVIRRASGLSTLRRAIAKSIGVGQWVPVRGLPQVPRTWRVLPTTGSEDPAAIPVYAVLERVSVETPAVPVEAIETETRAALPVGETPVSTQSQTAAETGSHTLAETETVETRETRSREITETGSHTPAETETGTAETRETGSRETTRDQSPRSRETTTPRSRPRETNPAKVSTLPDKAAETQKLLDRMWERGGANTVQLGTKTVPGEAETITGRPRSTAAKRLADARALFEAGHRTYHETETETGATGTDG
ncbi:DUF2637 domain-containing protein [Streptomyces sp. NPDC050204]|uniref:DUF2637 domain-containing protein n=1 Tax=Streptomyces sp. NPDC050204 TaxID=3155514 RepID=UPI003422B561